MAVEEEGPMGEQLLIDVSQWVRRAWCIVELDGKSMINS